jgi:hypothetical protein
MNEIIRELLKSSAQIDELERQYSQTWLEGYDAIMGDERDWILDLFEAELNAIASEIEALSRFIKSLQEVQ